MSAKVHVHLHVSDLAKSREFYRAFFGTAPVKDLADYVKFLPGWAPVNLALSEGRPAAAGAAVDHLGVQVDSPAVVSEHLARVKGAGLAVREEMGVDCCHANQDKFWVQDPDGVEWEVYHLNYDLAGGLQDQVKAKYGAAALRVVAGSTASCCGGGSAAVASSPVTANLYGADETATLPAEAVQASLGCGNPVALAELRPGEVVLDLGSGGGIDVLLSARRVGPTGKAYGLDMTDEMLALARDNQAKAGVTNVEFLRGEIEAIPLPDASVDVVISNCVINLSARPSRVLAEAFRVLRPGGRLAVSDIVVRGAVPEPIRKSVEAWVGCVAGALEEREYAALLDAVGFEGIELEPTRVYRAADARAFLEGMDGLRAEVERRGLTLDALLTEADGKFCSAFVRARKPEGRHGCCGR